MTKQDYVKIARCVATVRERGGDAPTLVQVGSELARMLKEDNQRFDITRFIIACGEQWAQSPAAGVTRRRAGTRKTVQS